MSVVIIVPTLLVILRGQQLRSGAKSVRKDTGPE